jgi:hypothetical protein
MRARIECRGTVRVPLSAEHAFPLFTPEGERRWVEGWSPSYPQGAHPALSEGLVFEVEKDDGVSTWVVAHLDRSAYRASYVYVLPGRRATLIDISVRDQGSASSVDVRYDMTSLSPDGDRLVHRFAAEYEAFLAEWESAIARHVARG